MLKIQRKYKQLNPWRRASEESNFVLLQIIILERLIECK
jgi:hypothetical protein